MRAAVGLFPGVRPLVTLQQPRSREQLAADLALVVELVGQQVHGQGRHAHVGFAAGFTLLGRVRIQTSMSLFVSRQIRGGGVLFAALGAYVVAVFALGDGLGGVGSWFGLGFGTAIYQRVIGVGNEFRRLVGVVLVVGIVFDVGGALGGWRR